MYCTWRSCREVAVETLKSKDGEEWAHLCPEHKRRMDLAFKQSDAKAILHCWVMAQGGSTGAMKRFGPQIKGIAKFIRKWVDETL